jgi:thiol:disulfide interchange protein DsbA
MKNIFALSILLLFAVACSKEEAAQPAAEEAPVAEETVVDEAPAAEATEAAEETIEVVEESAAEAEPEDEAIVLAVADTPEAPQTWKYKEGQHYTRMVPTQPTVGGADKVEVAEFFWYGCPHCFDAEAYINAWSDEKPANSRLVKMPVVWNPTAQLHARMFFTAEVLVRNGKIDDGRAFHQTVFQEYHRRGNQMATEAAIAKLFTRFGVSQDDFESTWGSFEVDQKLRVANDLMRRYKINSVPTVVVNGKYRTSATEVGSYPGLIELIDELIVRESIR